MKKGKKWKKIEAFCILLIVTLLLIFVRILYQPGTESERGELYTFSNGWSQLKDGKKTELKLPCFVTADKDGQIFLCRRKSGRKCYQSAMKLKRMPDYMCMPR